MDFLRQFFSSAKAYEKCIVQNLLWQSCLQSNVTILRESTSEMITFHVCAPQRVVSHCQTMIRVRNTPSEHDLPSAIFIARHSAFGTAHALRFLDKLAKGEFQKTHYRRYI